MRTKTKFWKRKTMSLSIDVIEKLKILSQNSKVSESAILDSLVRNEYIKRTNGGICYVTMEREI
jgi:hypothetical protein